MKALLVSFLFALTVIPAPAQASKRGGPPVSISIYDRTRLDVWQWFAAPPNSETYSYTESLLRIAVARRTRHWDWMAELSQPAVLGLPKDSVSAVAAQGQLGLGATYYAANGNNDYPATAFFKQGFLRYHFKGPDKNLRLGRYEFFEGQETTPKNRTLLWLQNNRIGQRLVGNFGFTNAQRSFDGVDGHYGSGSWDLTGIAARADQGVFNMNGNPELNVDLQYMAFSKYEWNQHLLWRVFAMDYHDGRTGILKTDNRPLAVRQADKKNIRLGTYGGDFLTSIPAGPGNFDFLAWGVLQNGNWGKQSDGAGAVALEGGYQLTKAPTAPWLRGGWFRSSGDKSPGDSRHSTFFQVLPTPRVYARFPFYNLMNNQDTFVQAMDTPTKKLALRSDLHWLQLTSNSDLWYQGGGAFDNKVFGYVGRPNNGHSTFASVYDMSADWQATKSFAFNFYYAHAWGKSVIAAIYPTDRNAQYGYAELVYRWGIPQRDDPTAE
ncbi:alginate export family protein [Acidipila rosea]|uniref:Alginate export protein n=1 Tax=Acidipila rosea TaxID=768535 RepID=A0A4R1L4U1_9BACT|nr:alginate export family protein [Acidipila rosea]TCK72147.1 alginate export protein [Acidipila rosea]